MNQRRLSREIAMQLMFQWELQGLLSRKNTDVPQLANADIGNFLGHFLHNFYVKDKTNIDMPFTKDLVLGTLNNIVYIDSLLDNTSTKWRLNRMDAIDRAILRVAGYELGVKQKQSERIIINEAIEIAKRYGSEQSPSFVNGILDSIKSQKPVST